MTSSNDPEFLLLLGFNKYINYAYPAESGQKNMMTRALPFRNHPQLIDDGRQIPTKFWH